jgi:hypothetical protein
VLLSWEFKVAESAWAYRHHCIFQSNEVKVGIASQKTIGDITHVDADQENHPVGV